MRISDWSSDVCSSDLARIGHRRRRGNAARPVAPAHDSLSPLPGRHAVSGPAQFADEQLVDLASIHIDDLETPALVCEALALLRQMLQDRQRVARGDRIVAVVVEFDPQPLGHRSEEHTSELQSLMRISYAVF